MPTAQALNFQLLEDIHEAQYRDDQVDVFNAEARKFLIQRATAREVLRLYSDRGIALHNRMTDDMLRSCFYEYAGAMYHVPAVQIEVLRSMV